MGLLQNMFGKKREASQLSVLQTDIHSHLIPGIDDGAQTMEESLGMVRKLVTMGYKKLITTPHIMSDAYRNTPEIILSGLEKLREAVREDGLEIEIEAAAEYYLDEAFIENMEKTDFMTFGGTSKYILFETSYVSKPLSLKDAIFKMKALGYAPVLAPPERYQYFWDLEDLGQIRALKKRGALMQVNLTSFAGTRGRRAARIAKDMAKEGLIDFIGTDLHRKAQFAPIQKALENSRELKQLLSGDQLLNKQL